ncbi:MAG TPA: F0F1 ATP synthase subunit B [Candidatus Marinimicrobia bacterium]|mgnify:FL=1|jgi:F-type H+-transporting ATPase subunit b|nr:F0F1 ATP synthase subunit B [Candidatus Neomarinimicrobiota bacterium]HHZ98615.1 F0F1 ATP synthase subunit B [Candidatus Neomarinimicrobiota bacterium]HIB02791.1 F0F1 ATP synthase subunit B [Candidatus Neomarinimicrobiota bacterium]HIB70415.1 F0F1 ATP synthase subunit B [Candidatus Neomarinimicrobiota bacterium]HIB96527.1 F0F1 ATP synthase subunit B [Candidatus Neomarinimicrobiota bacterium]
MDNPLVQLDPGLYVWTILTFLLLFFLLAKFAWKPLLKALSEREEKIRSSLEKADEAQQKLERLSAEGEKIIGKARAEAQSIVSNGKVVAEKVRDEIEAKAKEKAKTIVAQAGKQITAEKEQAISDIRGEVASLSIQIAGKLIRKNLSKKDNMVLIKESLEKAEKVNEA